MKWLFSGVTALAVGIVTAATAVAQQLPQVESSDRLKVRTPIGYPFQVDPMVHRLQARRGQTLPVTFQLIGKEEPTTVIVNTVALRQEENGVIMPDEDVPPPEFLRIENPGEYEIKPDEIIEIRGEVRLPADSLSNFHSYGLLVKDMGRALAPGEGTDDQSQVGINFITQYLCRTDIQVLGVRGESFNELVFESAELAEFEGGPMARVWVHNPTDAPLEFQMRCRLTSPTVLSRQPNFALVMPVRANLSEELRLTARILPESRLRMEGLVPYPLFPGEYELQAEILDGARPVASATFQVNVGQDQFPALSATIAQVTDRVTAVPSQVELSLRSGGNRSVPVSFNNSSSEVVDILLAPGAYDDAPFEWLSVRPDRLRLQPGQERKALVLLGANRDIESHRFATVLATAMTEEGELLGELRFPVALVGRNESGPVLNVTTIEYEPDAEQPTFVVKVENTGRLHLPLDGELVLAAEHGPPLRAVGGHGRWLMPGQTGHIRFPLKSLPEAALYELQLRIETADPETPFEFRQVLEVN